MGEMPAASSSATAFAGGSAASTAARVAWAPEEKRIHSSSHSAPESSRIAEAAIKQLVELKAAHQREIEKLRAEQLHEIEELNAKLKTGTPTHLSDQSIFKQEKRQFIELVKGAIKGKDSPEYKQLYHYLLKCFTDADNNFDGRVGFKEFEMLIEAAAFLPRRFGYAPSTPELYETDWERLQARMGLFAKLKHNAGSEGNKDGYISFGQWLEYAIGHIAEKARSLNHIDEQYSRLEQKKEDFREFIIAAAKSRKTREYKELYHFVLKCFTDADKDLSGLLDFESVNELIDISAAAPRRFGFAPQASDMYTNEEEKLAERRKIFESLDVGKTGRIDFDTWLHYIYTHICEKTALLGESDGKVPDVVSASTDRQAKPSRTFVGWTG